MKRGYALPMHPGHSSIDTCRGIRGDAHSRQRRPQPAPRAGCGPPKSSKCWARRIEKAPFCYRQKIIGPPAYQSGTGGRFSNSAHGRKNRPPCLPKQNKGPIAKTGIPPVICCGALALAAVSLLALASGAGVRAAGRVGSSWHSRRRYKCGRL